MFFVDNSELRRFSAVRPKSCKMKIKLTHTHASGGSGINTSSYAQLTRIV